MTDTHVSSTDAVNFITVSADSKHFALPIDQVHDVFKPTAITPVPLAPHEIVGLINLRGHVVTAISLRRRLALPAPDAATPVMAVGLERNGETFALVVDEVGEAIALGAESFEPKPVNLDGRLGELATCIHRLPDRLITVLDVDLLLQVERHDKAA